MDWDRLESTVTALLGGMSRYGQQPVDPEAIFAVAFEQEPNWRSAPGALLYAHRALDLIDLLALAMKPDGYNRQLSEDGRLVLMQLSVGRWRVDRANVNVAAWAELEELTAAASDAPASSENVFVRLSVRKWRQFESIEINFHPRLTILTGANGAGKTTILNILAPHFSWNAQLVSSSKKTLPANLAHQSLADVGRLYYSNGGRTSVVEPLADGVHVSSLQLPTQQPVPGIFISSHRSISSYQQLQSLPARFSAANVLLAQFASEVQTRYLGGMSQFPPLYRMKEALIAAAMHGYGNAAVAANEEARAIWEGFQDVLREFLPQGLQFRKLFVQDGDVLIETSGSNFPLEAVSGGLSAMIELAWQIFLRARDSKAFTVCIDEPENHLHPELQRTIVPALLNAFPGVTFVIATHSPFVVTASSDCSVYALTTNPEGIVHSRLVQNINSSGTSDETLMSVLGLDTPLPLWAENRLGDALAEVPPSPSAEELRLLRRRLSEAGLDDQFPAALIALTAEGKRD